MTRLHALARGRARPALRRLRRPLAVVGRRPRGVLGLDLGVLRRQGGRARTTGSSAGARCRAPSGSRARGCPTPSTSSAASDDDGRRDRPRSPRRATAARSTWGELRAQAAAHRGRACARWASAGRPRRRVPAEHPRDDRGLPGLRVASARSGRAARRTSASRSVVDRFAQIEPKVLLAVDGYRYGGKDFDRREASRSCRARCRRSSTRSSLPYLDPEATTGDLERTSALPEMQREGELDVRASCRSTIRSGSSTPRARPGCRRRSSTGQGGILLEHLKKLAPARRRSRPATASSGSPRPAG